MEKIYLDVCALKRTFDDQRQLRVRREAHAVAELLELCEKDRLNLVCSPAHIVENDANPREDRRLAVAVWLRAATWVKHDEETEARSRQLKALGFSVLDALHLAYGERSGARWLVTCDDRILKLGARHEEALHIAIIDPCAAARQIERDEG